RDEHVNEYITKWFNGDITRKIKIINLSMDSVNPAFITPLLEGHTQARVEVIEEKASVGIQKII
ncbi:MAG TPA: hypothetical protein DF984_02915, partial [Anaerolineaceae bacterium]|nr:hypothetical protein [Anaerolineaceae bacterium]